MGKKPSVFISYAHKDGLEFVRRFAFALEMYLDVFWDRRLKTGDFNEQLYKEIEAADYFLLVITPFSLASEWCQKELNYAEELNQDGICLAKIYEDTNSDLENRLQSTYTFGDFREDFDVGFKRITQMTLGSPYSSWEYLTQTEDKSLLNSLKEGHLPGLISIAIIEWGIVEKLWGFVRRYFAITRSKTTNNYNLASPHTIHGIFRCAESLRIQGASRTDAVAVSFAQKVKNISEKCIRSIRILSEDNNIELGKLAASTIQEVNKAISKGWSSTLKARELQNHNQSYRFDVTEKTRELINIHSRRSRYLY